MSKDAHYSQNYGKNLLTSVPRRGLPPPPSSTFFDLQTKLPRVNLLPPPDYLPPPPSFPGTHVETLTHPILEHTFEIRVYDSMYVLNTPESGIIELLKECYPYEPHFIPNSLMYVMFDITNTNIPVALFLITPEHPDAIPPYLWDDNLNPSFYLYDVCTDPHFRGHRLQELLLKSGFKHLKHQNSNSQINIYLEVLTNNPNAIRLYDRLGFEILEHVSEKWKSSFIERLIV